MRILAALLYSAALAFAADVTGTWTANVVLTAGSGSPKLELKQSGEALSGTYHGQFGDAPLTCTVKCEKIEFSFGTDTAKAQFAGTIEGGTKITGTVDYGELGSGTFTATKD